MFQHPAIRLIAGKVSRIVPSFGLLLLAVSIGRSTPADRPLFPIAQGSQWEYSVSEGVGEHQMSAEIVSSITKAGKTTVRIAWTVNGKEVQTEKYMVSKDGVFRFRSGPDASNQINPGIPIMKYPLQIGSSWDWKGMVQAGPELR